MPEGTWPSFVRRVPLALVVTGAAGVGLAWVGECWFRSGGCFTSPAQFANATWKSVALVVFQSTIAVGEPDPWPVVVGRLMAPALSGGALLVILNWWVWDLCGRLRLKMWSGHTVVFGTGHTAQTFARSLSGRVAFVGTNAREMTRDGAPTVRLQAPDAEVLDVIGAKGFGVMDASRILIATGNDSHNLAILSALNALPWRQDRTDSTAVEVVIEVTNAPLCRELDARDEFFVHRTGGRDVKPFHRDLLGARRFMDDHPLVDLAVLRAQARLRLLVVGLSPFVLACLEAVVRRNPYPRLATPEVDLFVTDLVAAAGQLRSAQPAFWVSGQGDTCAPADAPLHIRLHQVDDATRIPTPDHLLELDEARAAVTAVVLSDDDEQRACAMALALRDRCATTGVCRGPLFVRVVSDTAIRAGLAARSTDPDPGLRIVPVGAESDVCDWDWLFGAREAAARHLHQEYLAHTNKESWPDLPQTLRNANRRAIDQLPAKLMMAGLTISGRPLRSPGLSALGIGQSLNGDPTVEALAAVEHASWDIDRRLDGWRHGALRDERRRVHPMVGRSFEDLPDDHTKDLDRSQVHAALRMLEQTPGVITVRRELRIGVIGSRTLTAQQEEHARAFAAATIRTLAAHTDASISILSPLAPGSDLIMTRMIMTELANMGHQQNSRVVHVRSVPTAAVLARFISEHPGYASDTFLHDIATLLSAHHGVVADLEVPGIASDRWHTDHSLQEEGFRRANAYLVSRCHHLIVFGRIEDRDACPAAGGTREAVEWAAGGVPELFTLPVAILHAGLPTVHSAGPLGAPQ